MCRIVVLVAPTRLKAYLDVKCSDGERPQVTLDALKELLAEKGVTHGVKEDALWKFMESLSSGRYVVAEAIPAEPAVDETVEVLCRMKEEAQLAEKEDGSVDFRETDRFPTVESGETIAVKRPGIPGKPGFRVDGELLLPSPPRPAEIEPGKNVTLSEDDQKVLALKGGRPVVRVSGNRWIVSVEPVLRIDGDVSLETGNVRFQGDVRVSGSVRGGMEVEASGSVFVASEVAGRVFAEDGVTAARVIAGSVRAGCLAMCYSEIRSFLTEMQKGLLQIAKDAKKAEEKRRSVLESLEKLSRSDFSQKARDAFVRAKESLRSAKETDAVSEAAQNLLMVRNEVEEYISCLRADVTVQYVMNATLEAAGQVRVTGSGAFNSVIRAGGGVKVAGVLRGGELNAGDDVSVKEVGSAMGVPTRIKVSAGKRVRAEKLFPGAVVQIGGLTFKPDREIRNAFLRVEGGEIKT